MKSSFLRKGNLSKLEIEGNWLKEADKAFLARLVTINELFLEKSCKTTNGQRTHYPSIGSS